jgi:transcriptional regulator with XRE-family HTH domain
MLGIDKLRFLRLHYGLRQVDIADYLGVSVSTIKQIETFRMDVSQEQHDKWLEACRIRHIAQPKDGVRKHGKKSAKME